MNMLYQELKRSFRSWLYFTIGILATFGAFAGFFNVLKEETAIIDQMLRNFPPEFKAAFGFADVSLSEAEGFFSFLLSYTVLIGAVYGMKLGVSLLSEESRKMTSDFLLTKPVRRSTVITAKLAASLICLVTQNILAFTLEYAIVRIVADKEMGIPIFALMSFSLFFVQLFFIGIGFFIAAVARKIKSVMPVTLGIVFFFFIIELINESLLEKKLTYVTPFAYFKGSDLIKNRSYDLVYLLVDLAVFVVFIIMAYRIYQKKDIHAI